MLNFIVLGIIPGTHIQITFTSLALGLAVTIVSTYSLKKLAALIVSKYGFTAHRA
jgi:hypothetical protein